MPSPIKQIPRFQFAFRVDRRRAEFTKSIPADAFGHQGHTVSTALQSTIQTAIAQLSGIPRQKRTGSVYAGFDIGDDAPDTIEEFRLSLIRRIKALFTSRQIRSEAAFDGAFGIVLQWVEDGAEKPTLELARSTIRRVSEHPLRGDTVTAHTAETIVEPLTFDCNRFSIPRLSETFSPDTAAFLRKSEELNNGVDAHTRQTQAGLRGLLRRLERQTFPAEEGAYRESFLVSDALQQLAQRIGLLLMDTETPVFVLRRPPPASDNGCVVFGVHEAEGGTLIRNTTRFPALKASVPPNDCETLADFELARQRHLEKLRLFVRNLWGYRPKSHAEASAIISDVNRTRRQFGGALLRITNGDDTASRVMLRFSNGSFQLRSTARSREYLDSSVLFPELHIADAASS